MPDCSQCDVEAEEHRNIVDRDLIEGQPRRKQQGRPQYPPNTRAGDQDSGHRQHEGQSVVNGDPTKRQNLRRVGVRRDDDEKRPDEIGQLVGPKTKDGIAYPADRTTDATILMIGDRTGSKPTNPNSSESQYVLKRP